MAPTAHTAKIEAAHRSRRLALAFFPVNPRARPSVVMVVVAAVMVFMAGSSYVG
jgi:hypothetical protein